MWCSQHLRLCWELTRNSTSFVYNQLRVFPGIHGSWQGDMVIYSPELCKHAVQGEGAGRLQMELPDPNVCSPFSPWVSTVWKEGQGKVSLLWSRSHRKHLLLNIWCGIKPIPGTQTLPFPWFLPHRKSRKGFWEEGRWPVGCRWHSRLRVELLGAGSG